MTSKSKYQIWITYNGEKEKIRLPVLPEEFTMSMGTKDQSVDIVGLGEILVAQGRPATEFSFKSFLPAATFPGIQFSTIYEPKSIRDKLLSWKNSKKPVHLIITGLGVDCYCRITKFKPTEKGGDIGTVHYDITLKEYRATKVRQVKVEVQTATATVQENTARPDNTVNPRTYTVKKGDCLWNIAKKFYGNGAQYTKIVAANSIFKTRSPNLIYAGEVLVIP